MKIIRDGTGKELAIKIVEAVENYEAITFSPKIDGFTFLTGFVDEGFSRDQLRAACEQTEKRKEVCILPSHASSHGRLFLVPVIRAARQRSGYSKIEGRVVAYTH